MDIHVIAGRATIIVSLFILGYNLLQLSSAHQWVVERMGQYRDYLRHEAIDVSWVRRFNVQAMLGFACLYGVMLFLAGLAWWILAIALLKIFLSTYISDLYQHRILLGHEFSASLHRWVKMDALSNTLLLSFLLYVILL